MNIDEKDIIILDDEHRYFVVKKLEDKNTKYYYVSDIDNKGNIKFLYEDKNELVEIENKEILDSVIVKMFNTIDLDDFLRELKNKLENE